MFSPLLRATDSHRFKLNVYLLILVSDQSVHHCLCSIYISTCVLSTKFINFTHIQCSFPVIHGVYVCMYVFIHDTYSYSYRVLSIFIHDIYTSPFIHSIRPYLYIYSLHSYSDIYKHIFHAWFPPCSCVVYIHTHIFTNIRLIYGIFHVQV